MEGELKAASRKVSPVVGTTWIRNATRSSTLVLPSARWATTPFHWRDAELAERTGAQGKNRVATKITGTHAYKFDMYMSLAEYFH
jgi:hypothetical protein